MVEFIFYFNSKPKVLELIFWLFLGFTSKSKNMIDKIAEESVNNHEIYTFSGGAASRSTYYELHFIPNYKISENEMKPYAKEITEKIFLELLKYEYKKSSSWATSYPKIRINIHYYNSKNSTYKWIYINVLELKKYKSFEEFYKEYE